MNKKAPHPKCLTSGTAVKMDTGSNLLAKDMQTNLKNRINKQISGAYSSSGKTSLTSFMDAQLKSGPVKKFSKKEIEKFENNLKRRNNGKK